VTLTDCSKLDDAGLKLAADLKQLEQLELGRLALPDERLPLLAAFAHLKELKLIDRSKGYSPETQAKIKALLPKVDVKFQ
ncbi:MAG: G protein-coupled receptor LGR4, partial [Prosthecobacter sp.]|nr:G protein-coupled receptor LGR4 [Prosthecobacter sp.]